MPGTSQSRNYIGQLIYRHRLWGKRAIALARRIVPEALSLRIRSFAERIAFSAVPQYQRDTLPPIFHYWSSRYLAPALQRVGLEQPEDLYLKQIVVQAGNPERPISIASFGCGACDMEIGLALSLKALQIDATIDCIDLNAGLLQEAGRRAEERGVSGMLRYVVADCNRPMALDGHRDVVLVNQFFHHVENLEHFTGLLESILAETGVVLTCDVVGRNGHVLWPHVDDAVQAEWRRLPPEKRHDRYYGKPQKRYRSVDHASYSNEGVRAQDIVAVLLERFDFELFLSYGAAIMPFVERRIGFNFEDTEQDRALIDRIASADQEAIRSGRYPASNMIAILRHRGGAAARHYDPVSPHRHVELTRLQRSLADAGR